MKEKENYMTTMKSFAIAYSLTIIRSRKKVADLISENTTKN